MDGGRSIGSGWGSAGEKVDRWILAALDVAPVNLIYRQDTSPRLASPRLATLRIATPPSAFLSRALAHCYLLHPLVSSCDRVPTNASDTSGKIRTHALWLASRCLFWKTPRNLTLFRWPSRKRDFNRQYYGSFTILQPNPKMLYLFNVKTTGV